MVRTRINVSMQTRIQLVDWLRKLTQERINNDKLTVSKLVELAAADLKCKELKSSHIFSTIEAAGLTLKPYCALKSANMTYNRVSTLEQKVEKLEEEVTAMRQAILELMESRKN
jgi:hypothetical protein